MPKHFYFVHFLWERNILNLIFQFEKVTQFVVTNHHFGFKSIALHMNFNFSLYFHRFCERSRGLHNPIIYTLICFLNCKNETVHTQKLNHWNSYWIWSPHHVHYHFWTLRGPIQCSKWGEVALAALVRVPLCSYESHIFPWKK